MPVASITTRVAPKLTALPVINLAPFLKPEDSKGRLSAAAQLHAACLEYGFFYLDISTYVDPEEQEELMRLARKFFAQSQSEKEKIGLRNEDYARGEHCQIGSPTDCAHLSSLSVRVCQTQGEHHQWQSRQSRGHRFLSASLQPR